MNSASAAIVVGLSYGDEGKGCAVDYLTRTSNAQLVVRYNGGPQAGHTVTTPSGERHVFSQFGSGTFAGASTFLSRYMLINPENLLSEAAALATKGVRDPLKLMNISENALVISPFHIAANRLREWSRKVKHGTCGMGIGETVNDSQSQYGHAIKAKDLWNRRQDTLIDKLLFVQSNKRLQLREALDSDLPDWLERERRLLLNNDLPVKIAADYYKFSWQVNIVHDWFLEDCLLEYRNIIFEGAQGALLHQDFGFSPHVTWADTSCNNAKFLIRETGLPIKIRRIGALRAYSTRHGAGPFPSEDNSLSTLPNDLTNQSGPWQGSFRRGHFNAVVTRYALEIIDGVDEIHLACLDEMADRAKIVVEAYTNKAGKPYQPEFLALFQPSSSALSPCHQTNRMFDAVPSVMFSLETEERFLHHLEHSLGVPISVVAHGPCWTDRRAIPSINAQTCGNSV